MTGKPEAIWSRPDSRHSITVALGPDDRAIPSPRRPPGIIEIRRTSGDREFRRNLLVNLDAQTRLLPGQHVAVLDFRAAHKYVLRLFGETAAFMDAEVVTHQLERQLRGVRQRRRVTWSVPGGTDTEKLAQRGDLARRTQTADLRNVDADEINQPLFDEGHVFVLGVEQFTHGQRRTRLLAQQAEMIVVFRRERVFQKKQTIGFERLAQIDRLIQRHALVHVVQELDIVAEFGAQVFK